MFYNTNSLFCLLIVIMVELMLPAEGQLNTDGAGIMQVAGEKQYFVQKGIRVSFYRAWQICSALNMTLASIESATEQQKLKNFLLMNSALSLQYWLSGNDLAVSREFVWFGTGDLFSYTSWASGAQTNINQRCIRTDTNFNWRRDSCNSGHYFICEKPVQPACGMDSEQPCILKPFLIY